MLKCRTHRPRFNFIFLGEQTEKAFLALWCRMRHRKIMWRFCNFHIGQKNAKMNAQNFTWTLFFYYFCFEWGCPTYNTGYLFAAIFEAIFRKQHAWTTFMSCNPYCTCYSSLYLKKCLLKIIPFLVVEYNLYSFFK